MGTYRASESCTVGQFYEDALSDLKGRGIDVGTHAHVAAARWLQIKVYGHADVSELPMATMARPAKPALNSSAHFNLIILVVAPASGLPAFSGASSWRRGSRIVDGSDRW